MVYVTEIEYKKEVIIWLLTKTHHKVKTRNQTNILSKIKSNYEYNSNW